jgi:hypothetical protein
MHRIEIRFPEENWWDSGEPDRFAMLLEFMFEEMEVGFSLEEGGPHYRAEVDDLKRALDAIIQLLKDAGAEADTIVRVIPDGPKEERQIKTYRLGDLA